VVKGDVLAEDTRQGVEGKVLKKQLKMRHMTMISLGGVIGAGLFVGSGAGGARAVREVGK